MKASQYAYHKGLEKELNPNFKLITKTIEICNISVVASLWIRFTADKMKSYFTLEKDGKAIYEEFLHRSDLGFEIFLDMYKDIIVKDNTIIITGFTDIDYFPVKIAIDEHMLNGIEE